MKQKVFNLIILDESGSMTDIEKEALIGVNETIQAIKSAEIKHESQDHFLTLVTFNSEGIKTVNECENVANISEISKQNYNPWGRTPLYYAIGNSLLSLSNKVGENDRVLVTIITDGYENESKEFNQPMIKDLIDSLKKKGWIFAFIGANQDVVWAASRISITNTLSFSANPSGTKAMFAKECEACERFYSRVEDNCPNACMSDDYFNKEEGIIARFFKK